MFSLKKKITYWATHYDSCMPKCTPSGKKMSSPEVETLLISKKEHRDFCRTQTLEIRKAQSLSQQMLLSIYYVLDTVHSKQGQSGKNLDGFLILLFMYVFPGFQELICTSSLVKKNVINTKGIGIARCLLLWTCRRYCVWSFLYWRSNQENSRAETLAPKHTHFVYVSEFFVWKHFLILLGKVTWIRWQRPTG